MELGAERHSVDHDRVVVGVVIEHDDLEDPARLVGSDDEVSAAAGHDAHGVADCVPDVFVSNSMLPRAVRDLHSDKATLSEYAVKVALSIPAGDPHLRGIDNTEIIQAIHQRPEPMIPAGRQLTPAR